MSDDKVVPMNSPNLELVEQLEDLLEQARRGEISDFAGVGVSAGSSVEYVNTFSQAMNLPAIRMGLIDLATWMGQMVTDDG